MKKNSPSKNLLSKSVIILLISLLGFLGIPLALLAQDPTPQPSGENQEPPAATAATIIRLVNPAEGSLVIGKKPEIRFVLLDPGASQDLVVMLDGTDITNVLKQQGEEYSFKPITALSSGQHSLQISAKTNDGQELSQEATFNSRQTEKFEEAYSDNDIGLAYKKRLAKSEEDTTSVEYRVDGSLSSNSKLKGGNFETSLTTNMHYANQDLDLVDPETEGVNLDNYLWQTKYTKDKFSTGTDVGDLQVDETLLTLQGLARRGGRLNLAYDNLEAHGYIVNSKQLYGFYGGTGIGGASDEHILGADAIVKFFNEALMLKGVYVKGGETESSYGIWTEPTPKRGDAYSFSTELAFFDKKLLIDAEYAKSKFDGDINDNLDVPTDKAYSYGFTGVWDIYTLKANYHYLGPQYFVIGNSSLQNDNAGFEADGGASFKTQTLNLTYSQYHDNVESDPLITTVTTTEEKAAYTFSGVTNLTLGLNYDHSLQKGDDPFSGTTSVNTATNTYSGSITYLVWKFNLGLQVSFSDQDDRTLADADTETKTYTFTPALNLENLVITPGYSYNTSWDKTTDITTTTRTATLNLTWDLFDNRWHFETAGTHNRMESSDGSTDQMTLSVDYRISYVLAKEWWGFENPSLGIECHYGVTQDYLLDTSIHDKLVYLVFKTNLPLKF
jgi:hypothetical protein